MARYFALTTTNAQQNGFHVIAEATTKAAAEAAGRTAIGDIRTAYGTDIYRETEHKNLVVVSATTAQRRYGLSTETLATWNLRD